MSILEESRPSSNFELDVNAENPWVGLHEFTEGIHEYFYGRGIETDELMRMVSNKTLTILFGQSGLGKSSLVQAGLFPKLRSANFLPVYIRLNYKDAGSGREAPTLRAQVLGFLRRAVHDAIARGELASGPEGSLSPEPLHDETLWEYLHRRERPLRRLNGSLVIPVLVFDQFEEIFTLGRNSRVGQDGERPFLRTIAECIENRIPKGIGEEIARCGKSYEFEDLDFNAEDYRIIFSLREDYVAYLDDLSESMPSIMENRMRLLPLDGRQAIEAVMKPGGKLVKPSVARQIVRFTAASKRDGNKSDTKDTKAGEEVDLAEMEVDPALLSMICCELNKSRQSAGLTEITTKLLGASSRRILQDFYQGCFSNPQMQRVRIFVEEELLTASDFRDSIDYERAKFELKQLGVADAAQAIERLVRKRLLRVVERGSDIEPERIELTHDVLTGVVSESRRARRLQEQRESEERAKREREAKILAEAERRRREAEKQLRESRRRQATYATLLLLALGAIAFGVIAKMDAEWKIALQNRNASEDNYHHALELLEEKSNKDTAAIESEVEPGIVPSTFTHLVEPKGRILALTHLAKALEYHPKNSDAFKSLCNLLTKYAWCPPLTPIMRPKSTILAGTWAPDGSAVALTESGDFVRCDLTVNELRNAGNLPGPISSAFFSEDGQRLIAIPENSARCEAHFLEWDGKSSYIPATQKPLEFGDIDSVRNASWSPNGEWLIIISASRDKGYLFKRREDGILANYRWKELNEGDIRCATFINDGSWIAAAHRNGEVKVWELRESSINLLETLSNKCGRTWRIKANPNRLEFVTVSRDKMRLFRIEPLQRIDTSLKIESYQVITVPKLNVNDRMIRVAFSPDGKRIASGTFGGLAQVWDSREVTTDENGEKQLSKTLGEPMFHRGGLLLDLVFSRDGNSLLTFVGTSFFRMNSMQIWDTRLRVPLPMPSIPDEDKAPDWLPKLAEAVSGTQLTLHGYESTPRTAREIQADKEPLTGPTAKFGTWVFSIYGR